MTKAQIIKETVDFYAVDPDARRSVLRDSQGYLESCLYNGPNNTHCGLGRCLTLKALELIGENKTLNKASTDGLVRNLQVNELDDLIQEQYKGHSIGFWTHIQQLHDGDRYWDKTGLSERGISNVTHLCSLYSILI